MYNKEMGFMSVIPTIVKYTLCKSFFVQYFFLYENSFRVTTPLEFNLNFLIFREDWTIFSNDARILFFVNFHLFVDTSFELSTIS